MALSSPDLSTDEISTDPFTRKFKRLRSIDLQTPEEDKTISKPQLETTAKVETPEEIQDAKISEGVDSKIAANKAATSKAKVAAAGVGFFGDVMNIESQYAAVKGESQLNIYFAQQSVNEALSRGATRKLKRVSEGVQAGESAQVHLAAQGLDVNSASSDSVVSAQEAVGIFNGMMEEINASREALGYEQEIVQLEYNIDQAKIQRDTALIGAGLNFAASSGVAFI